MPRFYLNESLAVETMIAVTGPLLRHLHVLRLQAGDNVTLFNGQGGEYHGIIQSISKSEAKVDVDTFDLISRESPLEITIVQCLSSADRMDYTIQKATECGVSVIQPVMSQRSQSQLSGERAEKKRQHWQAIAVSASEQSGRTCISEVLPVQYLTDYFASHIKADLKLVLSFDTAIGLHELHVVKPQKIAILIGPEGGLTQVEEKAATKAGFVPLNLGPRILRTETVAPVIASLLQYHFPL